MAPDVTGREWSMQYKGCNYDPAILLEGELHGKGCWSLVFKTRIRWNPMTSPNLFFFHCHVMALGLANSAFLFVVLKKSQWNNLILSAFFCDLILSGLRWIKRVHNKVTFAQIEEGFDCKLAL